MRHGGRPLRRKYGQREERQLFLIYCEGKRTEVDYFKGVRRDLRASTVQLEIIPGGGEPFGLVRMAIDRQAQKAHGQAADQTWCVFDAEAPQPHAKLEDAITLAKKHGIECAISNPCFELFLLWHFRDHTAYLSTEQACRLLQECPCGYRQRAKRVDYGAVRPGQPDAMRRAAQRHRLLADTPLYHRNPGCTVHLLLEALLRQA
ncbi:RloB family protein [Plantactinospora sp. B6F1]|uniref:RloB family protein n=1 Tax=Plantactinospora sp. B6F1 TaxID=3158971 RepID=UPI0032D9635B